MDSSLYRDINRFAVHTSWLHPVGKVFAVYAVGLFGLIVLAAWYLARRQPDAPRAVAATLWAAAGTLVAVAINQPIGHAVARARPYAVMPHVEVLVSRSTDYSFPSDHAITAGAATAGVWIVARYGGALLRNLAIGSTVLALVIAFARVYPLPGRRGGRPADRGGGQRHRLAVAQPPFDGPHHRGARPDTATAAGLGRRPAPRRLSSPAFVH